MFARTEYELLDFGDGRKLERFGPYVLDRPCPAAEGIAPRRPDAWAAAHARFCRDDGQSGTWQPAGGLPEAWNIRHGAVTLQLKPTPAGHLGVFPEQAENWDWIAGQIRAAARPLKVLNLFAYTGGSTLAAAAAGAKLVHVDAAANTVGWARRNAELSGFNAAPVRWIVEDAARFAAREVRRGNDYDAVILDPPSYGHGPKGRAWKLSEHLPALLRDCGQLTAHRPVFVLLTCHTPGVSAGELARLAGEAGLLAAGANVEAHSMTIRAASGAELPSGVVWRAGEARASCE